MQSVRYSFLYKEQWETLIKFLFIAPFQGRVPFASSRNCLVWEDLRSYWGQTRKPTCIHSIIHTLPPLPPVSFPVFTPAFKEGEAQTSMVTLLTSYRTKEEKWRPIGSPEEWFSCDIHYSYKSSLSTERLQQGFARASSSPDSMTQHSQTVLIEELLQPSGHYFHGPSLDLL